MASKTLTASMVTKMTISETLNTGLANSTYSSQMIADLEFASGATGVANSVNEVYCKASTAVTLNSNSSVTYTLTAITDDQGRTVNFANGVRGLAIYVTSRSAGDYLNVGAAASNAWTGLVNSNTAVMKVYDFAAFGVQNTDKLAVANGSSEQVKITNAGTNAISFKLAIIGNT